MLLCADFRPGDEFTRRRAKGTAMVKHGDIGTLLLALRWKKGHLYGAAPRSVNSATIASLRRRVTCRHSAKSTLRWTRTTCRQFEHARTLEPPTRIDPVASTELFDALWQFIDTGNRRR
jgi:hypothetical protein